ncbi:MAG: penicillin-binding protein 2 [Betaproteobacteria bacterium]|nr:penicillin-binding protein 2 [Betaproteobacteria bacterium]
MNVGVNSTRLNLRLDGWRSRLLLITLITCFAGLAGRAAWLQGVHAGFLQQKGDERYSRVIEMPASRGIIRDRNGQPLAISTPSDSIWASREDIALSPGQYRALAGLLHMDPKEVEQRLTSGHGNFVYLKRQVAPEVAQQVMDLGLTGLYQQHGFHRAYPKGEETAHLVGFTDADDHGQEGVELTYQAELGGSTGARRVIKDRTGQIIEDVESIRVSHPGKDIVLSVDGRIQHLAYRELRNAVTLNRAKAGAVVILDTQTGEVLALANYPDYDPNKREHLSGAQLRNRAITDTFEPGSTLKPFTIATALETGKVTPTTVIATGGGQMTIGSSTIRDTHPSTALTVAQVIQHSSNVGAARIALALPPETLWNMFTDVGFGQTPKLGFPGEAGGRVRPFRTWKPIEQATMSYGTGISVSLIQLARAYTIFANNGMMRPLSLTRVTTPAPGRQVISALTAHQVSDMLELVVKPEGTAPAAQVRGYRVAGKTGTAHKLMDGRYVNRYVASFVGFAPASAPRVLIAVMIDEPAGNSYYGGMVAAPVFSSLMGNVLQMLAVPPDDPTSSAFDLPHPAGTAAAEDT